MTTATLTPVDELTRSQKRLLDLFVNLYLENGSYPTVRHMAAADGSNLNNINQIMCRLAAHGWVRQSGRVGTDGLHSRRHWELTEEGARTFRRVQVTESGLVRISLLVPSVSLTPEEAGHLGRELQRAALEAFGKL